MSTLPSLPARALGCDAVTYQVTVIAPDGSETSAVHCAIGALASWLHLDPEATIEPSSPLGGLGSLYIVRFEDVSTSKTRELLQLRLYPQAAEGPVVFLPEPGFIETQGYTGSVARGWRTLDPEIDVPPSLTALGVPDSAAPFGPLGDGGPPVSNTPRSPDVVSLLFLAVLVGALAAALVRRRRSKVQTPASP